MATKRTTERTKTTDEMKKDLRNEDPISGAPGSHPVGTGVGAALGGAAAGAAAGAAGGPVGAAIGAVAGAVAGGYGGKAVSETLDPTVELSYWEGNYHKRDYYDPNLPYEEYEPAYRFAIENYQADCQFEECSTDLRRRWEAANPNSRLNWDRAKMAMQDSWKRISDQRCPPKGSCQK